MTASGSNQSCVKGENPPCFKSVAFLSKSDKAMLLPELLPESYTSQYNVPHNICRILIFSTSKNKEIK